MQSHIHMHHTNPIKPHNQKLQYINKRSVRLKMPQQSIMRQNIPQSAIEFTLCRLLGDHQDA